MGAILNDDASRKQHVRAFRKLEGEILELGHDAWMNGRAMYLLCALQLARSFPQDGILQGTIERLTSALFDRAEETARELHNDQLAPTAQPHTAHSRLPALMVKAKDGLPWAGAARGLAGLLHALLEVPGLSAERLAKIRQTVDW